MIEGLHWAWTQPSCDECWEVQYPGRNPMRLTGEYREREVCCFCGSSTDGGIYVRVDPETVDFPSRIK